MPVLCYMESNSGSGETGYMINGANIKSQRQSKDCSSTVQVQEHMCHHGIKGYNKYNDRISMEAATATIHVWNVNNSDTLLTLTNIYMFTDVYAHTGIDPFSFVLLFFLHLTDHNYLCLQRYTFLMGWVE